MKVLKWILMLPLIALALFVLARFLSCGPNSADVKIMKPMAEKISNYIVKNGIPKSLKDIPDLPYGLEGCERSEEYWDNSNNKTSDIEKRFSFQMDEKCYFYHKNRTIKLDFGASSYIKNYPNEWGVSINMRNSQTETVLKSGLSLKKEGDHFIMNDSSISVSSSKNDGICSQMRQ